MYLINCLQDGHKSPAMLFTTKKKAFETMKKHGWKYNQKEKFWWKKGDPFQFEIDPLFNKNPDTFYQL